MSKPSVTGPFATINDLVRRQVISKEIAQRLALLPEARLVLTLATIIVDIPNIKREHIDQLLSAGDSDQGFEKSLLSVKRQVSVPTHDLYAQYCYSAIIRYIGVAETIIRNGGDAQSVARFMCQKILRPVWGSLSLHTNIEEVSLETKRFKNETLKAA